jgi:hypothetical protein
MTAAHVLSDSDALVMLGAGSYLVKAYLPVWNIVVAQGAGQIDLMGYAP